MADERDRWSCYHFSLANPTGRGQDDVPRLLRGAAREIAALGDIEVMGMTMEIEANGHGSWPSVTVYYSRASM